MSIGENIRKAREMRGLDIEELAVATGFSSRYIQDLENGTMEVGPSNKIIHLFSKILGVPASTLVTLRPEARPDPSAQFTPPVKLPNEVETMRSDLELIATAYLKYNRDHHDYEVLHETLLKYLPKTNPQTRKESDPIG